MAKKIKKYEGTSTLEILEGADNYNRWIASELLKYASPPILEFGSGTGNITQHFIHKTPFVVTEIDPQLIKRLRSDFGKRKGLKIFQLDITRSPSAEFHDVFNTVFSSNVLEHIENDLNALKNLKKTMKKNGRIVMLVPAKKAAYSRLDKQIGHYRRYEKEELRQLIEKAGFEIEKIYFFNIVGILAWKTRDLVTRNTELKSSQVRYFDAIVPILKILEGIVKPPIGISLIVVAKNKK